jgi:hypothetical protein
MDGQPESASPSPTPPPEGISPSQCSGCPLKNCPLEDRSAGSPAAGWRLGLVSLGLFLGPVVLAIVGAVSFGGTPGTQLAGAIAGLGLGLAGSLGMARILHRSREKTP